MTLTEYLQQVSSWFDNGANTAAFLAVTTQGDSQGESDGQVHAISGGFSKKTQEGILEGAGKLFAFVAPETDWSMPPKDLGVYMALSLNVSNGLLTIMPQGASPAIAKLETKQIRLQYYNGVLYGLETSQIITLQPVSIRTLEGPVLTITLTRTIQIP